MKTNKKYEKIEINEQILDGNFPEGFLIDIYLIDLEKHYKSVASDIADDVVIQFDRQNASGCTRAVSAFGIKNDGEFDDISDIFESEEKSFWDSVGCDEDYYDDIE